MDIHPYAGLNVADGMTDAQIDGFIRSSFAGGAQRLRIYNDKTNYKFGKVGNFNIWLFGNATTEGTGIAIDHWSDQVYTIHIDYPDAKVTVFHLANKSSATLDISKYTWTSGSATVNRIGDMVFVVLGILNVTCASSGKLLKIPDGFTPNNWTSIPFLYKQKGQDQMVCGSANISEGYIIPTVALTDAHVILNTHWKV